MDPGPGPGLSHKTRKQHETNTSGTIRWNTSSEGRQRLLLKTAAASAPSNLEICFFYAWLLLVRLWQIIPALLAVHAIVTYTRFYTDSDNQALYVKALDAEKDCRTTRGLTLYTDCPKYVIWAGTSYWQNIMREVLLEHCQHVWDWTEWLVSLGGQIGQMTNWCPVGSTCRFFATNFIAGLIGTIWWLLPALFGCIYIYYYVSFVYLPHKLQHRKKKKQQQQQQHKKLEGEDGGEFEDVDMPEHQKPPHMTRQLPAGIVVQHVTGDQPGSLARFV